MPAAAGRRRWPQIAKPHDMHHGKHRGSHKAVGGDGGGGGEMAVVSAIIAMRMAMPSGHALELFSQGLTVQGWLKDWELGSQCPFSGLQTGASGFTEHCADRKNHGFHRNTWTR